MDKIAVSLDLAVSMRKNSAKCRILRCLTNHWEVNKHADWLLRKKVDLWTKDLS